MPGPQLWLLVCWLIDLIKPFSCIVICPLKTKVFFWIFEWLLIIFIFKQLFPWEYQPSENRRFSIILRTIFYSLILTKRKTTYFVFILWELATLNWGHTKPQLNVPIFSSKTFLFACCWKNFSASWNSFSGWKWECTLSIVKFLPQKHSVQSEKHSTNFFF